MILDILTKLLIPKIRIKDKAQFYENIANLLDGWVTLMAALSGYKDRTDHLGLKSELDTLLAFVEWGDAVSIAMRKLPNLFREGEVAIIESGEQTGNLHDSFMALAKDLRDQEELRNKVKWALTYPFVIFLFLIIAIVIVMAYVIPQIIPIIADSAGELPLSTKSLIFVSDFIKEHIVLILIFLAGVALIWKWYTSTELGKYRLDKHKFSFPVVGEVYRNYITVRVMTTLSLLIGSGVVILKTLRLTGASAGNLVVQRYFLEIADQVARGKKIHESMKEVDPEGTIFTSNILQMIESGERTSTLDTVASKLSTQYRREVDTSLAIMVKFIEPIALLVAGVFVLWFAIAIFSAIMQVVTTAWV